MRKKIEVAGKTLEAAQKKIGTAVRAVQFKLGDFAFKALDFGYALHEEAAGKTIPPREKFGGSYSGSFAFKGVADEAFAAFERVMLRESRRLWTVALSDDDGLGPLGPVHTCEPPTTVTLPVCGKCLRDPALTVRDYGRRCARCWRSEAAREGGDALAVNALLEKVDLSLFAMPLRLSVVYPWVGPLSLRVEMLVPDREDPSHHLSLGVGVSLDQFPEPAADEAGFLREVRAALLWIVTHELDEAIVVDGLRRFDPHEQPAPHDPWLEARNRKKAA